AGPPPLGAFRSVGTGSRSRAFQLQSRLSQATPYGPSSRGSPSENSRPPTRSTQPRPASGASTLCAAAVRLWSASTVRPSAGQRQHDGLGAGEAVELGLPGLGGVARVGEDVEEGGVQLVDAV